MASEKPGYRCIATRRRNRLTATASPRLGPLHSILGRPPRAAAACARAHHIARMSTGVSLADHSGPTPAASVCHANTSFPKTDDRRTITRNIVCSASITRAKFTATRACRTTALHPCLFRASYSCRSSSRSLVPLPGRHRATVLVILQQQVVDTFSRPDLVTHRQTHLAGYFCSDPISRA